MNVGEIFVSLGLDTSEFDKGLETAEQQSEKSSNAIGGFLKGAVLGGALAAGAAVLSIGKAALDVSSEIRDATGKMQAELGLTEEQAKQLGDVAVDVFADNFAGSITEAGEAVAIVKQQLGGLVDDSELKGITEDAFRLKDAFGLEVNESVSAAKTLMENFGLTSQQAFDFIAKGQQEGLNRSGDFLDTINEYSTQFKNGGASAEQFFSLIETGSQGGALGTDKAADAFKEFGLRIADGSATSKTALTSLGIDATKLWADMSAGKVTTADAFTQVIAGLNAIEDPVARNAAGVALLGTQYEDLGASSVLGLDLTKTSLDGMSGSTASLDAQYTSLSSVFEGFGRQALVALQPLGDKLLELANQIMPYVSTAFDWLRDNLPGIIAAASTAITVFVEFVRTVFNAVADFLKSNGEENQGFFKATWDTISAIVKTAVDLVNATIVPAFKAIAQFINEHGTEIKQYLNNTWIAIQSVINIALALIQGIIRTVLALIRGDWQGAWQAISETADTVWTNIKTLINAALDNIKLAISLAWTAVKGTFDTAFTNLKNTTSTAWEAIKTAISTKIGEAKKAVDTTISGIGTAVSTKFGEIKTNIDTALDNAKRAIEGFKEGFTSAAAALGNGIVNGVIDAVNAGAGRIAQIVRDAIDGAIEAAKRALGLGGDSNMVASSSSLVAGSDRALPASSLSANSTSTGSAAPTTNITIAYTSTENSRSVLNDVSLLRSMYGAT